MILVDTSIWSVTFRRRRAQVAEPLQAQVLRSLILEDWPLAVPGVVLQELLSGLREPVQFKRLLSRMAGFPVVLATREDHLRAAQVLNRCRSKGVTASTIDSLIAAMAICRGAALFTADHDFTDIAEYTSLRIFSASS